jgi:hypothetical protein
MFLGSEKFVNLLEELAAGAIVFVIDDHLNAVFRRLNGSSQSGRSGTDTYHFISAHDLLRCSHIG